MLLFFLFLMLYLTIVVVLFSLFCMRNQRLEKKIRDGALGEVGGFSLPVSPRFFGLDGWMCVCG